MSCYLGLDSKKDCRGTPCRSCTANEPSAASAGYRSIFHEWYQNDSGPWTSVKYEIAERAFLAGMLAAEKIVENHCPPVCDDDCHDSSGCLAKAIRSAIER